MKSENRSAHSILLPAFVIMLALATSILLLTSVAEAANPTTKKPAVSKVQPRDSHRQSMGSRHRTRAASPVPQRRSAENTNKATERRSNAQSATSIVGRPSQYSPAGPAVNASTPAGIQPVAVPGQQPRQSQQSSTAARSVTRTTTSGKSTTMTASAAK